MQGGHSSVSCLRYASKKDMELAGLLVQTDPSTFEAMQENTQDCQPEGVE